MSSELSANYLGLQLDSPVIVGSCPLTMSPESVRQFVLAGAGAIVLPSILQEQIVHQQLQASDPMAAIEQSGYQPQQDKYNGGVDCYLKTLELLKQRESVPIIASINGGASGKWLDFAKQIESSGADALELNWQPIITNPDEPAAEVESKLCDIVHKLCASVTIPVAVKLNQRFTNLAAIAHQMKTCGAKGLVLFTHVPHWDVSIDRMHWTIRWELSPTDSLGSILEGIVRARTNGLGMSIAASGGVRTGEDAIKSMIAGADVVMVTSEIYREGPDAIRKISTAIARFLDTSRFDSLQSFLKARPKVELGPERLMRLEYVDPLSRSNHYFDPTPVADINRGDSFGHLKT
ncbi:dihydroorotate dehydrogenase-like protein [Rubripirellula amarantea]|uniref:NAD-dependent dihydropyrimidine dehydrogenase subunit PreA n=1 Tax=Rubripirellula amarantea TaxID=2527999 RepID=A0A5C5WE84_9BACT|nr:dihydroorotate dehydrogenase-like protein [Rubripirellula amarantea]MDA8743533.1 dihydroorotate dehydrogenase-like protein [Rubripirellula amarantea]TWT48042.1 NAD-dependent dihydropyrimidine dehydrogenase subunit PreA [Rubripirellula amarantea]